ncbi:glutamine-hydrolyzing GMP synthase subunit GuaA [Thermoplasmatales archaeon SW_10_69_26]|nr:MAG: glutamine-hydrolyzing GMP synthase subunit GuaA [Thermoplasmatales archaeon SW_10_69_26]
MVDPEAFVKEQVEQIQQIVDGPAIIACSGGVDSTVAAVLAGKAVPQHLTAVFVDTGLMRKDEPQQVERIFEDMGIELDFVDARDRFFDALEGVTDPEEKRNVVGEEFIRVFEEEAEGLEAEYLVQGTIAPDWIESGDETRDTIKSHHNVGGLPEKMDLEVVEPLYDLYKDEVREVARHFDLPVAERQPFPGPGLAIRTLGEVTPERVDVTREACAIVEEELEQAAEEGKMQRPWQYYAALLPVQSVGVQGDVRAYGETIAVRAVDSLDGMTASFSEVPLDVLDSISTRITNQLGDHVNRVVYDVTNKPPGTVEWE